MTEETDMPAPKPAKRTIRELLLKVAAPQPFETEGLGSILVHRPTAKSEQVFSERVKDPAALAEAALVRAYLGSTSGFPTGEADTLPEPLTEDEVSKFTQADIDALVVFYLEKVAEVPVGDDPVHTLAELIKNQIQATKAATKAMLASAKNHLKEIRDGSTVLKNWAELQKNYGDVNSLQSQVDKFLGPSASIQDIINKALYNPLDDVHNLTGGYAKKALDDIEALSLPENKYQSIVEGIGKDHAKSALDEAMRGLGGSGSIMDAHDYRLQLPVHVPFHETPAGRAAQASEDLVEAAEQIKDSIVGILKQVGLVTEHSAEVSETIREQAQTFLKEGARQNAQARRFAMISNGLAAFALLITAAIAVAGFVHDRRDSQGSTKDAQRVIDAMREQNQLLKKLALPPPVVLPDKPAVLPKATKKQSSSPAAHATPIQADERPSQ